MPSTRPAAQTFRDLLVWQKAHQFVLGVYQLTAALPRQETFGLALQMRRAAVSIAALKLLEEVSRLLNRYTGTILASGS